MTLSELNGVRKVSLSALVTKITIICNNNNRTKFSVFYQLFTITSKINFSFSIKPLNTNHY